MKKLGLTGSIGMGKTETGKLFEKLGFPLFDADATVHRLYAKGGAAVPAVGARFPEAIRGEAVDRAALSKSVLGQPAALKELEAIVHPLVQEARQRFLAQASGAGAPAVVYDIPLLFETGAESEVDVIFVVSAPYAVQKERVLARPGMSPEKFDQILGKQTPDAEKRARADFIIETDKGLAHAEAQLRTALSTLGLLDQPPAP